MTLKKPECVLHIGAAKTGTTSLQFGLSGYDDGESIYATFRNYPDTPNHSEPLTLVGLGTDGVEERLNDYRQARAEGRAPKWPNSIPLQILMREGKAPDMNAARAAFEDTISSGPHTRVIYSAESLFSRDGAAMGLVPILQDRFASVRAICYLRSCLGGFLSGFQQRLAQTNPLIFFSQGTFRDLNQMGFRDATVLEQWLTYLPEGQLTLAVYDRARLANGDVVDDFCSRTGLDAARTRKIRTNTSFSAEATAVLAALARFGKVAPDNPHFARNKAFFNVLMYEFGTGQLGVSDGFADQLFDKHWQSLDWLDAQMGCAYTRKLHKGDVQVDNHEDLFEICAAVLPDLRAYLTRQLGRSFRKLPLVVDGFAAFMADKLGQPDPFPKRRVPARFEAAQYLLLNPDIARLKTNPKSHFLAHGCFEGRFF